MYDNEFLESKAAQNVSNGTELGILALARSLNNLANALGDNDEIESEEYDLNPKY